MRPTAASRGFQRLAAVATGTTLVLIALGGAVRATDSGLACPTWPGCFTAGDFIPPADLNVWLEHTHRLVAGVVAVELAVLAVWAIARHRRSPTLLWPAVVAAVAVVVQALLGAAVVWLQLRAELVTSHLGLAMLVLACLLFLTVRAAPGTSQARSPLAAGPRRTLAGAATAVAALAFVQILVGGHVTGVGAGLAFGWQQFPLADGTLARLGDLDHREFFHVLHRGLGYVLAVAVVALAVHAGRFHRRSASSRELWLVRLPALAVLLVVLQIGIGFGNLVSELSYLTVIPHLAVASWLWAVLVTTAVLAWRSPAGAVPPAPDGGNLHHEHDGYDERDEHDEHGGGRTAGDEPIGARS